MSNTEKRSFGKFLFLKDCLFTGNWKPFITKNKGETTYMPLKKERKELSQLGQEARYFKNFLIEQWQVANFTFNSSINNLLTLLIGANCKTNLDLFIWTESRTSEKERNCHVFFDYSGLSWLCLLKDGWKYQAKFNLCHV